MTGSDDDEDRLSHVKNCKLQHCLSLLKSKSFIIRFTTRSRGRERKISRGIRDALVDRIFSLRRIRLIPSHHVFCPDARYVDGSFLLWPTDVIKSPNSLYSGPPHSYGSEVPIPRALNDFVGKLIRNPRAVEFSRELPKLVGTKINSFLPKTASSLILRYVRC